MQAFLVYNKIPLKQYHMSAAKRPSAFALPWHFRPAKAAFGWFSLCTLPMAEWLCQFRTAKPLEKTAWSGEASLPTGQTTRGGLVL